jgi:hypothetical protein
MARSIVFSAVKSPNFFTRFCRWFALTGAPLGWRVRSDQVA